MRPRNFWLGAPFAALVIAATVMLASSPARATEADVTPSDLSFSVTSPHAGNSTGATVTYNSVSGWRGTNVVLTLPGWTALNPIANTGPRPCPDSISVTAKPAGVGRVSFSQCTWTQTDGSALFSVVVNSASGLDGPVTIGFTPGMLQNPVSAASYSVRLSEQSNAGWVTLTQWTPIDVPSDFTFTLKSPAPGILTPATAAYTSASGWADTNVVLTLPGFIAQNTFPSTGGAACPASIAVSATPSTATISQCSWQQVNGSAILSFVIDAPNTGLAGTVNMSFSSGMLRNPLAPAQYTTRLAEQSSAGWVSMEWWVNVGVPVELKATLNSYDPGSTTGAVITYNSGSNWVDTNVSVTFPGWTALRPFASTRSKPCPTTVKVTATPPSAVTNQCTWTMGSAGATLSFVLSSPQYGLQGPVRIAVAQGLLRNPESASPTSIRLAEQSGAGWVGLTTPVLLRAP